MRPIMTAAELASHKTDAHGRDYSRSDDGYGDMEVAATEGWSAISCWGSDGWDLGDWPYVVISIRIRNAPLGGDDTKYQVRQTCEGDTTVWTFDKPEDCRAAIDYLFIWYGLSRGYDEWAVEGLTDDKRDGLDAGALRVPEKFRGPYPLIQRV